MCTLESSRVEYLAAYSYGISPDGDAWGEAVARATGVPVHQYDCTMLGKEPSCLSPPCNSMFHNECLAGTIATRRGRRFRTLVSHMKENGHDRVSDGQLLL